MYLTWSSLKSFSLKRRKKHSICENQRYNKQGSSRAWTEHLGACNTPTDPSDAAKKIHFLTLTECLPSVLEVGLAFPMDCEVKIHSNESFIKRKNQAPMKSIQCTLEINKAANHCYYCLLLGFLSFLPDISTDNILHLKSRSPFSKHLHKY